jgi:hypothetical protein
MSNGAQNRFDKWEKARLQGIFSRSKITESNFDIPLLLMTYLGLEYSKKTENEIMEMRKELEFYGYKVTVGVLDYNSYSVGIISWPGIRGFSADELRKYRYVMFQTQMEIDALQNDIERVLRESILGG